jgi:SEC-C motif
MGAIADGFVAYAQPLLDQTDGSHAQLSKAMALGQFCYNLALFPDEHREKALSEMRATLEMDDAEFDLFLRSIVVPMIERHQQMFPRLHNRVSADPSQSASSLRAQPRTTESREAYPGTDRYAPCPCNSGQKYKFCCGLKRR